MNKIKEALDKRDQSEKEASQRVHKQMMKQKTQKKRYNERLNKLCRFVDKFVREFKKELRSEKSCLFEIKSTTQDTENIGKKYSIILSLGKRLIANADIIALLDEDSFGYYEDDSFVKSTKTLGPQLTSRLENFFSKAIAGEN